MDTENIQVVRALWGNSSKLRDEIPSSPLFNEVVYVWGSDNAQYLLEHGYNVVEVSSDDQSSINDLDMYFLKARCWELATRQFQQILFLDWDISILKPLDELFWNSFKDRVFCAPLYAYPSNLSEQKSLVSKNIKNWINIIDEHLDQFSWSFKNLKVLPNAGLVYLSSNSVAKKVVDLIDQHNLKGLIEEFALFKLSNCTLEQYIVKHEPSSIFGRPDKECFTLGNISEYLSKDLNKYILKLTLKNVYLEHY